MPTDAAPRPSASVILVRDGLEQAGLETFMVQRHAASPVAPSAYVFPGGTVRADDFALPTHADAAEALGRRLVERSDSPLEPREALAICTCAVRELFEEAGVWLVRDSGGHLLEVDARDQPRQEQLATLRLRLQARELSLGAALAELGLAPAFERLVPFSHWVTPRVLAARFDARFFVAAMPPRQEALHCTIETQRRRVAQPAGAARRRLPRGVRHRPAPAAAAAVWQCCRAAGVRAGEADPPRAARAGRGRRGCTGAPGAGARR